MHVSGITTQWSSSRRLHSLGVVGREPEKERPRVYIRFKNDRRHCRHHTTEEEEEEKKKRHSTTTKAEQQIEIRPTSCL